MKRVFAILEATEELNIESSVRWSDDEGNIYQIEGENITNEQLQQIENKADEILSEYKLNQYSRNRKLEYPPIEEQLDMLYWDRMNGTERWIQAIKNVKDKHPKK